jgi:hypothetical protein
MQTMRQRRSHHTILRILLFLGFATLLAILAWQPDGPANAQEAGPVQELTGYVRPDGVVIYLLPDLTKGESLFVYLASTSGNLDPIVVLAEGSADLAVLGEGFRSEVRQAMEAGEDPLVAFPEIADSLFLAWDDDGGAGYDSALEFTVPADGDYQLLVGSTPVNDTFGDFRLLLGLDAPEVLAGDVESTGDIIAVLNKTATPANVAVQELTGTLTADDRFTFYNIHNLKPGDTLYVFAEATAGDLIPTIILEDFGNKPIRSGNFLGDESSAALQFTFEEETRNFRLRLSACCEDGPVTTGDYRLLFGVNGPEVLDGVGLPKGQPVVQQAIPVAIGLKMQQITGVDQKAENFGVVASLQMKWQDPALAFSPDDCQCNFKTFSGSDFVDFVNENGITYPEFTLFNQQGNRWTQNDLVVISPNGEALFFERFSATLQAPDFNFRSFPFDKQQFFIRIDSLFPNEFFVFTDLEGFSDLGEQLGEEEWIITDFSTEISTQTASTQRPSSRFSFGFEATRHMSFYVTRLFIPILVILIVSWFTFFLKDYSKRVDVSAGNLLIFIAFNFTISGDLPRIGYQTFLDIILISTFVVTGLVVIFNVILKRMELAGKGELAQKIDRYTIWIYPLAYVAAIAIVAYFFI